MSAAPPGEAVVMGVLNVTADSFSDGGAFLLRGPGGALRLDVDVDGAVGHGLALAADGADIVDVGGESTRPGATAVDPHVEAARVVPVIAALVAEGVRCSVDTLHADTAAAAVAAGATMVNDVSGGHADRRMAAVVADTGADWVLAHWPSVGAAAPHAPAPHRDVAAEVRADLLASVDAALAAGVAAERLVVDPGLGFAKDAAHNWALLAALPDLVATGLPVLVGASRKRFLGALLADDAGDPRPARGRDTATAAVSLLAARAGAWGVRVHDVRGTVDALAVLRAWSGR